MNSELWTVMLYEKEDCDSESSELAGIFLSEEKAINFAREAISQTFPTYKYSKIEIDNYRRHAFHYYDDNHEQFDDSYKEVTYVVERHVVANDILPCGNLPMSSA